ncbi:hypothetical protein A2U01_0058967, partial [Trifolium medium]|nr:hypothetical protein [Trifolium medium]
VLSSSPSLSDDDDFVAFAILNRKDFVFCKKSYDSWVLLNDPGVSFVEVPEITPVNFHYYNYFDKICYTVFAGED